MFSWQICHENIRLTHLTWGTDRQPNGMTV